MLNNYQFEAWLQSHPIPNSGYHYIRRVRENPPQRVVSGQTGKNVIGNYPSRKMGHTVQTESHTGERLLVIELEYSPAVKEYWDQPESIDICRTRADGRTLRSRYTADYLALEDKGAIAYEVKPRDKLEALVQKWPNDWKKVGSNFEFTPAKDAFSSMGISHVVKCSDELNPIRLENLSLMMRSRTSDAQIQVRRALIRKINRELEMAPVQRLTDLMRKVGLVDVTPIIAMIDRRYLFTNIDRYRLSDAKSAWVSRSLKEVCAIGNAIDGIPKVFAGKVDETDLPNVKELMRVTQRLHALNDPQKSKLSRTTLWRLRKAYGSGVHSALALMSKYANCGGRGSRLNLRHESLIRAVVQRCYINAQNLSKLSTYNIYIYAFEKRREKGREGFSGRPINFESFRTRIDNLDQEQTARARQGSRAGKAAAAPTDPMTRALRPLRGFERAHLDHWLCDIFVLVRRDENTSYALRPWVSFLIDEATGALLAFAISLNAPSRATCGRILRDCVRRHGRLPEIIITDAGADFRSNFYHELLASAVVEKAQRPVSAGRWGAPVERAFGRYTTEVIKGLPGNIRARKDDRATTREFRSDQQAAIDLILLHRIFESFTAEWFNAYSNGSGTDAPNILLRESLEMYSLSGIPQELDLTFMAGTATPLDRGRVRVDPQRGFRAQKRHYVPCGLELRRSSRINEIRVDPENIAIAYALSGGVWHVAYSGSISATIAADYAATLYMTLRDVESHAVARFATIQQRATIGGLLLEVQKSISKKEEAEKLCEPPIEIPAYSAVDLKRHLQSARPMTNGE